MVVRCSLGLNITFSKLLSYNQSINFPVDGAKIVQ
jgi:hypothetical protein